MTKETLALEPYQTDWKSQLFQLCPECLRKYTGLYEQGIPYYWLEAGEKIRTPWYLVKAKVGERTLVDIDSLGQFVSPAELQSSLNRSQLLHLGTNPVDCLAFLTNKNNISPDQIKVYLAPVTIGEKQRYALLLATNSDNQKDYTFLYLTAYPSELLSFPQQTGFHPEVIDAKTLLKHLN